MRSVWQNNIESWVQLHENVAAQPRSLEHLPCLPDVDFLLGAMPDYTYKRL